MRIVSLLGLGILFMLFGGLGIYLSSTIQPEKVERTYCYDSMNNVMEGMTCIEEIYPPQRTLISSSSLFSFFLGVCLIVCLILARAYGGLYYE